MKFFCNSCETNRDFEHEFSVLVIEKWGHGIKRFCKSCRSPKSGIADVFWDGKPEINLSDDPNTGKPRVFLSRGQKAAYLKENGLREAGDKHHGAFRSVTDIQAKQDTRPLVKEALHKVSQMGRDYRRREYMRILKEGQRHA